MSAGRPALPAALGAWERRAVRIDRTVPSKEGPMPRRFRSALKALAVLAFVLGLTTVAVATTSKPTNGTAWVGATHQDGNTVHVAGDIRDKVLGRGAIVFRTEFLQTATPGTFQVTARKLTIYTSKGTLVGTAKATQIVAADGSTRIDNGTASLTKGTGELKGHKLNVTFSGPVKDGVITLSYSGTYR
jgi:hypothetical protein